jgi:hypothetical protein
MPYVLCVGRADIAVVKTISTGSTPSIEVVGVHALETGDSVTFAGTNSTPNINGTFNVTVTGVKTFTITGVTVTVAGTAGTISGMTCTTGEIYTDINGSSTYPMRYYTTWEQVFEACKESLSHAEPPPSGSGTIYQTQMYFLLDCAVQAGHSGAAAALAWAEGYGATTTVGHFSLARF